MLRKGQTVVLKAVISHCEPWRGKFSYVASFAGGHICHVSENPYQVGDLVSFCGFITQAIGHTYCVRFPDVRQELYCLRKELLSPCPSPFHTFLVTSRNKKGEFTFTVRARNKHQAEAEARRAHCIVKDLKSLAE